MPRGFESLSLRVILLFFVSILIRAPDDAIVIGRSYFFVFLSKEAKDGVIFATIKPEIF